MSEKIDVRKLEPKKKHPAIFDTFDELEVGESVVIINDHDPVPLKYQFEAERGEGVFGWEYLADGPEVWRVEITKKGSG